MAAQPTRSVGFFPRVAAWKLPEAKASEGKGLGKHRRALFASSDRLVVTTCLRCCRSLEGPVQPHPSCGAVIGSASAEISIHRDTVTDQNRGGSGGKSLGTLAGRRSACPHEHRGSAMPLCSRARRGSPPAAFIRHGHEGAVSAVKKQDTPRKRSQPLVSAACSLVC